MPEMSGWRVRNQANSGDRIRTCGLRVMGPTSFQTAPPRIASPGLHPGIMKIRRFNALEPMEETAFTLLPVYTVSHFFPTWPDIFKKSLISSPTVILGILNSPLRKHAIHPMGHLYPGKAVDIVQPKHNPQL